MTETNQRPEPKGLADLIIKMPTLDPHESNKAYREKNSAVLNRIDTVLDKEGELIVELGEDFEGSSDNARDGSAVSSACSRYLVKETLKRLCYDVTIIPIARIGKPNLSYNLRIRR